MATTKSIIILGTNGNCVDALESINEINKVARKKYECIGFLDDDNLKKEEKIFGVPVLGPLNSAKKYKNTVFINGIGSPSNFWRKKELIRKTKVSLNRFETIVHPSASVSKSSKVGVGSLLLQNVVVSSAATIGNQVIILPNSVISHGCVIGDFCCIAAGVCISGRVKIEEGCYLGANSSVIGDIKIGKGSLIGMGSVVLRDVPPNSVVVGNPARVIRKNLDDVE